MGTWFSTIQINETLLQIHTFYITTNLSKQCRLAGLHELATVDFDFCIHFFATIFVAHNFVSLYSICYILPKL